MSNRKIPVINMQKTGDNIKELRKKNGLSVKDLQSIFGFNNPGTIYRWQHGDNMPTIDNLILLADVFHARIDEILAVDYQEI